MHAARWARRSASPGNRYLPLLHTHTLQVSMRAAINRNITQTTRSAITILLIIKSVNDVHRWQRQPLPRR